MGTLFWFVVSALMITIAPGTIDRVRQRVGASPFKAFALGIAAEVVFLPALLIVTVILSVSIVGLPLLVLLPLVALAFFGAMAVGFTSVAYALGAFLVGRFSRVAALTLGLAMVWGTGLIGRYLWTTSHGAFGKGLALVIAGLAIEYLVCTLGLGAALLAWNASRRERRAAARSSNQTATVPPPLPIATAGDVQGS
jgi:hypothetical protein